MENTEIDITPIISKNQNCIEDKSDLPWFSWKDGNGSAIISATVLKNGPCNNTSIE